jgi:hypothetical protein
MADYVEPAHRIGLDQHITAVQAMEFAGQLRAAAEEALRGVTSA